MKDILKQLDGHKVTLYLGNGFIKGKLYERTNEPDVWDVILPNNSGWFYFKTLHVAQVIQGQHIIRLSPAVFQFPPLTNPASTV